MNQTNSPAQAARDIIGEVGWTQPGDLSLEDIASSLGAVIREADLGGSEGRILMRGNTAIISINSSITNTGKKNFVIAHEIGHFVLHKDLKLLVDNSKTLAEWHKKGAHEQQANEFAEELLMPSNLFSKAVKGKKLSLSLIEQVASYFSVSLTAAFIRYLRLGDYPLMIVYIEGGIVKWKMATKDFPFQYIPYESKVPAWTVAGDFFNGKGIEDKPVKVDAIEWFPEDFNIKYKSDWKLWEQCFRVGPNGLVSCLWTY